MLCVHSSVRGTQYGSAMFCSVGDTREFDHNHFEVPFWFSIVNALLYNYTFAYYFHHTNYSHFYYYYTLLFKNIISKLNFIATLIFYQLIEIEYMKNDVASIFEERSSSSTNNLYCLSPLFMVNRIQ